MSAKDLLKAFFQRPQAKSVSAVTVEDVVAARIEAAKRPHSSPYAEIAGELFVLAATDQVDQTDTGAERTVR